MRSKVHIPVGQGCRKSKASKLLGNEHLKGRCECHPEYYLLVCMGCGDKFHSAAPHTKTCGDRCRKRLSRMRHDKMFQTVMSFANGL